MALHHFEKILADPQLGLKWGSFPMGNSWGKTWGIHGECHRKHGKSMGKTVGKIHGENTIKKTQGIEMFESKIDFYSS